MKKYSSRILIVSTALFVLASLKWFSASAHPSEGVAEADGWKSSAPRDEIRPAFIFKKEGGPNHNGSLIIRADYREGLDGHWSKTFSIKGGRYYRFHALR